MQLLFFTTTNPMHTPSHSFQANWFLFSTLTESVHHVLDTLSDSFPASSMRTESQSLGAQQGSEDVVRKTSFSVEGKVNVLGYFHLCCIGPVLLFLYFGCMVTKWFREGRQHGNWSLSDVSWKEIAWVCWLESLASRLLALLMSSTTERRWWAEICYFSRYWQWWSQRTPW